MRRNQAAWMMATYDDPGLRCDSADGDGTNDQMDIAGGLAGLADGKLGTVSVWVRPANNDRCIFSTSLGLGSSQFRVFISAVGNFAVAGSNPSNVPVLSLRTNNTYTINGALWYHILASWDLADSAKRHLYINGVSDISVVVFTNDNIDYTRPCRVWAEDAPGAGGVRLNGCLAELWFHNMYVDLSLESNRRKFRNRSMPIWNMGSDGSGPLGVQPLVYLHLDNGAAASNFATNKGTGGNFTITGALTTGSTSPGGAAPA